MISDSLNLGGALQQSIGGIETLFGAGGRSIEEYAKSVGKSVDAVKDEYASLMQSQQTVFNNAAPGVPDGGSVRQRIYGSRPPALPPVCCPA